MRDFLPWHGLIGGMLIGLSAGIFLIAAGRISGISGIIETAISPWRTGRAWSWAYLAGLPLGALVVALVAPAPVPALSAPAAWPIVIAAGLLVGFGARVGGGCTSGHGVCGLPRFSPRSFVATGIFMAVAAATVFVSRHLI